MEIILVPFGILAAQEKVPNFLIFSQTSLSVKDKIFHVSQSDKFELITSEGLLSIYSCEMFLIKTASSKLSYLYWMIVPFAPGGQPII